VGPQVNINFTKQFRTEVRVLVGGLWAQQPAYTLDRNDASGKHISTITVNNTDKITSAMAGSVGFAYQPGERIALFVNAAYYGGRPNYNDFSYAVKGDKTYTSTLKPLLSGAMLTAGLYLHL
jgi:hypothetical protein